MGLGNGRPKVVILANTDKGPVVEAVAQLRPWLAERAEIVGMPNICDGVPESERGVIEEADLAVALGGDGTMIGLGRELVDLGVPLLGINFGKLGFLAEYSLADFKRYWERIAGGRVPRSERLLLSVCVLDASDDDAWAEAPPDERRRFRSLAMNEVVVTAGPPFRMLDLELAIDPEDADDRGTFFSGDGVIVSTPTGSTGYNLSAGGPIVTPGIDAICVNPICPYSLAFRPIVVNARSKVYVRVRNANEGTTLVVDGQRSAPLEAGQRVYVRRYEKTLKLIHHPEISYWQTLGTKLKWAVRPG